MKQRAGSRIKFVMTGGISMILLVFVVLLLVSFASLSIAAAKADLRLSERYESSSTNYYAARNASQEFLQALDEGLSDLAEDNTESDTSDSQDIAALSASQKAALRTLAEQLSFTLTPEDDGRYQIKKDFPSGDTAALALKVRITPYADGSFSLSVLSEAVSSTQTFDYDSHLNVIQ